MARKVGKLVIHPILLTSYPILAMITYNLGQIGPRSGLRALGLALVVAGVLWGLLHLFFHSWSKAGVLVSLIMVLFLSYGHVYSFLETHPVLGVGLGRHRILMVVWVGLVVSVICLLKRKKGEISQLTQMLNVMGLVLLIFPAYQFAVHTSKMQQAKSISNQQVNLNYDLTLPGRNLPDIYYIILDGYPRQDILERRISIDNTPFLNALRILGFYVAECSQSNYAHTELSLASVLNFNYLEELGNTFTPDNMDRYDLWPLINNSQIRQILSSMGYDMVAFETGHAWTTILDAEYYFSRENQPISNDQSGFKINGLELLLLKSSMGLILTDPVFTSTYLHWGKDVADMNYPTQINRERVLYTIGKMYDIPLEVPSPKFVFAHIVSPHFPIVFGPDGEYVYVSEKEDNETYIAGYRGQIAYINKRALEIIRNILNVSVTPPIIILQSDHGWERFSTEDRLDNLFALYLPNRKYEQLYPEITSVNTFRVIFNAYFGGNFELLEDRAYFSTYEAPYDLTLMPNMCEP